MPEPRSVENYNYQRFVLDEIMHIMDWKLTPELGKPAPEFSLWKWDTQEEVSLRSLLRENQLTVVEFGSFT